MSSGTSEAEVPTTTKNTSNNASAGKEGDGEGQVLETNTSRKEYVASSGMEEGNVRKDSVASSGLDSETAKILTSLDNPRKSSNASSGMGSGTEKFHFVPSNLRKDSISVAFGETGKLHELHMRPRKDSIASLGLDSETGRLLSSFTFPPRKDSNASDADMDRPHEVQNRPRKNSIASLGMDSVTGMAELPEPIIDLPVHDNDEHADDNHFQVPASVPQHHLKLPADDSSLHVSFMHLNNPLEESSSFTGSKGSRNLPESRLPTKKRKMSYESYDSAMGDSYLGLASLDSGILPKLPGDGVSVNTKGSGASSSAHLSVPKVSALDHLDALGDDRGDDRPPAPAHVASRKPAPAEAKEESGTDDNNSEATFTSEGHRLLMEAIMMTTGGAGGIDRQGRKRLESWGGMSDLSVHMGPDGDTAAAIAASALHHTGIIDDITAAAGLGGSVASSVTDEHPGKYMEGGHRGRDRKGSTTSFSDSTFPVPSSLDGLEISSDLQQFVAAAVASVGDQLAELAGNIESAAAAVHLDDDGDYDSGPGSASSSVALLHDPSNSKGRSSPHMDVKAAAASAAAISVDYDAVAAAVDAAHAATGGLDLSAIIGDEVTRGSHPGAAFYSASSSVSSGGGKARKRKLPTNKHHVTILGDVPKSSLSEKEQEEIRERARKAAGYVPPSQLPDGAITPAKNRAMPPLKKRIKRATPEPAAIKSSTMATPKISNTTSKLNESPASAAKPKPPGSSTKGNKEKSTQKWDSMYDSLLQFVEDRKAEETTGMSDKEVAEWVWDGNVPTTYKTKDGKALGRWINNQRSAKSKGTLREDREKRLVAAGLKWSVLASNSWNEMLDELRIYIKEYTKDGRKWDGNVPTNYRIKARPNGKKMTEEDKNLGRWVNRQRSLYQAGKLREDRQKALEKVGLKWSMLATTSWDAMFETLVEYVEEKKKNGISWDGNVPANYRTDDNPPRALGRWINRQRSAHVKKKLKKEYVDKLSDLGLKWSVHERKYADDLPEPEASAKPASKPAAVSASSTAQIPSSIAVPAKKLDQVPTTVKTEPSSAVTANVSSVQFDNSAGVQANSTKSGVQIVTAAKTTNQSLDATQEQSNPVTTPIVPVGQETNADPQKNEPKPTNISQTTSTPDQVTSQNQPQSEAAAPAASNPPTAAPPSTAQPTATTPAVAPVQDTKVESCESQAHKPAAEASIQPPTPSKETTEGPLAEPAKVVVGVVTSTETPIVTEGKDQVKDSTTALYSTTTGEGVPGGHQAVADSDSTKNAGTKPETEATAQKSPGSTKASVDPGNINGEVGEKSIPTDVPLLKKENERDASIEKGCATV